MMLRRRVPIVVVIVLVVLAVAAGKAWAVLDPPADVRAATAAIAPVPVANFDDAGGTLLVAVQTEQAELARLQAAADAFTAQLAAWNQLLDLAGRIGRCEEPGDGWLGVDWTADGWTRDGHFAGGLGMRVDLYASLSGGHYAPSDVPYEQVRVFGLAWAQYGQSAWACQA